MINTEVYMDLRSVIHLKYPGNTRAIHVIYTKNTREIHHKYTDYTLNIHGINVLLHIHFFYTKYTISSSITPN